MTFRRLAAKVLALLLITTLLSSCVGLGVAIPRTHHETIMSPADKEDATHLVRNRADIIRRHGELDTSQVRTVGDIERITIDTGRQGCGVMLFILPIFPKLCKARMQYDLRDDTVITTHERRTHLYGYVCSVILPILGKNSFCTFLSM